MSFIKDLKRFFSLELIFQALLFGSSILIIRFLPKDEYGVYRILISVQILINLLTGSRVMGGFKNIGGTIWQDSEKLTQLSHEASHLRNYLLILSFSIASLFGISVLSAQDISNQQIFVYLLCVFILSLPELLGIFIKESLYLQSKFTLVQKINTFNQVLRFTSIIALAFILSKGFNMMVVLGITGVCSWISYFILKSNAPFIKNKVERNFGYKAQLIDGFKKNWHNAFFFAFRGEIAIFMIGLFGSMTNLANYGALTRYILITTFFKALTIQYIGPKFSRAQDSKQLKKIYSLTCTSLFGLSILGLTFTYFFSDVMLWLLGKKYSGLNYELGLVMLMGFTKLLMTTLLSLNMAKNWFKHSIALEIPLSLLAMAIGAFFFDFSRIDHIVYFEISIMTPMILLYLWEASTSFKNIKSQEKTS